MKQTANLFRGLDAAHDARRAATRFRSVPLRAPHHTSSRLSVLGALTPSPASNGEVTLHFRPGEISLAQQGFLLLTDLPEFRLEVLEGIGRAYRERSHTLAAPHQRTSLVIPVYFSLLATAATCPCGMKGAPKGSPACSCTARSMEAFEKRVHRCWLACQGLGF